MIKKFTFLDSVYKIKFVEHCKDCRAYINFEKKIIFLNRKDSEPYTVLFHELGHLFLRLYLPQKNDEEVLVDQLARFYGQVLNQISKKGYLK